VVGRGRRRAAPEQEEDDHDDDDEQEEQQEQEQEGQRGRGRGDTSNDDEEDEDDEDMEEQQEDDEEDDDNDAADDDDASTMIILDNDDTKKCGRRGAMEPTNILLPFYRLRKTLESQFGCPKCSKKKLKVTQETYGFATELTITCEACGHVQIVAPGVESTRMERGDDDNEDGNHNDGDHKDSASMFMDYGINYAMVLLMQHLGMGLRGVVMILAFLGIAAGAGNQTKWQRIQEELGLAEEEVANRTIENNIKLEIAATRFLQAQEKYADWLLTNEGTNASSEQEKLMKMTEFLAVRMSQEGLQKIGVTVGMDGAWQKRSIGRGSYNSKTGHNFFCVGGLTKKILSVVVYSKHCRTCEKAEGLQLEAPEHRCPRNYDVGRSSKAMEPLAAVAHCKNLAASADPHFQCYVAQLVTNDDSTTRANTKHSFKAVADRDYPGWTQKRNTAWPFKINADTNTKRTYLPDHGLLPLWVPSINKYLCDISHRVKVIGSAVYNLASTGSNPNRLKTGWNKYDAERIKFNAGYFFHQEENQSLPFHIFCEQVPPLHLSASLQQPQ